MLCNKCGKAIPDNSAFCPQCGQAQGSRPPTPACSPASPSATNPQAKPSGKGCKLAVFLGCGTLFLIGFLVLGILGFVFYKIKDSEAGRLAARSVRESPEARQALGEIQDVGWPIGSISVEGGGSGKASFSMSVKGSQAKGKYYVTMVRENNQWRITSARLELKDGRSIAIPTVFTPANPPTAPPPESLPSAELPLSGGRPLYADRSDTQWKAVDWSEPGIHLEVPQDWEQIRVDKRSLEFRPADRSAYLTANLAYFDQKLPIDTILPTLEQKAQAELKRQEIAGYQRMNLGSAKGLVQLQSRDGSGPTMAAYNGYYDSVEFGTVSITILVGAPTSQDFDRWETVLGAILQSFQIK